MTVLESEYEMIRSRGKLSNSTVRDLFFSIIGGQDAVDVAGI
jgi:hypothetical protein